MPSRPAPVTEGPGATCFCRTYGRMGDKMPENEFDMIGKLGFGLMRLPKQGEDIDIEQTKQMVDMFLDAGVT